MEDVPQRARHWVELIKELPNPYVWAKSWRDSKRAYRGDVANTELVDGCRELAKALHRLELNPSTFLYSVAGTRLDKLKDRQLKDPENLEQIGKHIKPYEDDFKQVLEALKPVEENAYVEIGEPVIQLRNGLTARYELLRQLKAAIAIPVKPAEIREIVVAFLGLIEAIEPIREEIRRFAAENDG